MAPPHVRMALRDTDGESPPSPHAASIGREVLDIGGRAVRAGVTCDEIDRVVHEVDGLFCLLGCWFVLFVGLLGCWVIGLLDTLNHVREVATTHSPSTTLRSS